MIGCLQQLQQRYTSGSQLLILHANPTQGIPSLAAALDAQAVFWNGMWNLIPNAIALLWTPSRRAFKFFPKLGSTVKRTPRYSLVLTSPTVYTPFWRNWVANRRLPVESLQNAED